MLLYTVFSLFSPWGAYSLQDLLRGGGGYWREGLIHSSKKTAMEIISLNCNKLKIITQYISYI